MKALILILVTASLAACGRPGPVAQGAENASELPESNRPTASASGGPPQNSLQPNPAGAATNGIPPGVQGRWGITPADCDAPSGQAEGLLVIGPNQLRFYESVAVPAANVLTSTESVSGTFEFTGEGQSWTKYQSLRVSAGKLTRTERDPLASFRYVRCD